MGGFHGPGLEETQNTWLAFHWPELLSLAAANCRERLEKVDSLYVWEEEENMGVSGNRSLDVWGLRLWFTTI